jgi:imidazolonepropionase-like amidohydrolase
VLIEGGRIAALGPSGQVKVPAGAVRIDGRGKYLIPGLADMHDHGMPNTEAELRAMQDQLSARLASGVTMIRHLGGPNHHLTPNGRRTSQGNIVSDPLTIEQVRKQLQAAKLPSPRMHIAPPLWLAEGLVPRDSLAAYLAAAKAAGYRHIGVTYGSQTSERDSQVVAFLNTAVTAARQLGLPIATHTHRPSPEEILAFSTTGGSVEHILTFYEERDNPSPLAEMPASQMRATAEALRRTGIWITPTLACHFRLNSPAVHPAMRQIVKTLQDVGVGLLLGRDGPGEVHEELKALVGAGLTPYQALLTGTRNPAAFYKISDSAGTVAVGKRADLVLLAGNPLADIRHTREPAGVMLNGQWLDRTALDRAAYPSPTAWLQLLLSELRSLNAKALRALADSLQAVAPSDTVLSERLRQRLTAELVVMRAHLTSEQHEVFDPFARVWLREQARQGARVTIPGVASTP